MLFLGIFRNLTFLNKNVREAKTYDNEFSAMKHIFNGIGSLMVEAFYIYIST